MNGFTEYARAAVCNKQSNRQPPPPTVANDQKALSVPRLRILLKI
jgi:hypothetical protein